MEHTDNLEGTNEIKSANNDYEGRLDIDATQSITERIRFAIGNVIVGQSEMVELLLAALLADGHVLIEGVPGVAKTLTAKTLSKLIDTNFSRIQFTPDLMPSDVLGTNVFDPKDATFIFKKGPIFSNVVLIDEINRSPAKTQAALFEVMEERQITVDGNTYKLQPPFVVIATQNPVEHEGTYRLPEAQLDRFLFKIQVDYPSLDDEVKILIQHHHQKSSNLLDSVKPIVTTDELLKCKALIQEVHVDQKIIEFIAKLTVATRSDKSLYLGASPRASIALLNASKAVAVLRGRDFVTPEDVLHVVAPVLRHRIALTPEREMEGGTADELLKELVAKLEVPR
jgi:MoxR-like ATPase